MKVFLNSLYKKLRLHHCVNHLRRPLQGGERGVAILMALSAIVVLTYVALEVSEDTLVDYSTSSQVVHKLQASYSARAGVGLGLLRLHLYKKILNLVGDKIKGNEALLDPIWQFPFMWPPIVPEGLGTVEAGQIQKSVKKSFMKAPYVMTIESEGARIDINSVFTGEKNTVTAIRNQIIEIFQNKLKSDEEFDHKYRDYKFDELANNIVDWIDPDSNSLNGGTESSAYQDRTEQAEKNLPPNLPFKTMDELHLVAKMTDEFYEILKDKISLYGEFGVNVNTAKKDVLKALDPQITDQIADAIIERRQPTKDGPFKTDKEFLEFLGNQGVRTQGMGEKGPPILVGTETNFRVQVDGSSGRIVHSITAVVFDIDNLKERMMSTLDKIDAEKNGTAGNPQAPNPQTPPQIPGQGAGTNPPGTNPPDSKTTAKPKDSKERPRVVYWEEN